LLERVSTARRQHGGILWALIASSLILAESSPFRGDRIPKDRPRRVDLMWRLIARPFPGQCVIGTELKKDLG